MGKDNLLQECSTGMSNIVSPYVRKCYFPFSYSLYLQEKEEEKKERTLPPLGNAFDHIRDKT